MTLLILFDFFCNNLYILEGSHLIFLTVFFHILLTASVHESSLHKYNKYRIHLRAVLLQFFFFLLFPITFTGSHKDVSGWLLKF